MEGTGKIDPTKLPEAPVAGTDVTPSKPAAPSAPAAKVKAEVADTTKSSPAVPTIAQTPAANGNSLIQLGAYGPKAVAEPAWTALSKRHHYLAGKIGNASRGQRECKHV